MKNRLIYFTLGILSTTLFSQNVSYEWTTQMGGVSSDTGSSNIVDMDGNIYTTGGFSDTVDFDPGTNSEILISNGYDDIFIQKLDPEGNLLWVNQTGGVYQDEGKAISLDENGNIFTIGIFRETVDFDPGSGVSNLTSNGGSDIFIQKLDSDGNFLWAKQIGGVNFDFGSFIDIDPNGNIFTTGPFQGVIDFDPGSGIFNLTSNGFNDIFVLKLDTNGNFLWAKKIGGSDNEGARTIFSDTNGNTYITGSFRDSVDFDPGTGSFFLTSNGETDIYVLKLDPNGNFIWVKQIGGTAEDYGRSSTDLNGNVYTTGGFLGTVDFDPGTGTSNLSSNGIYDIFIQKLDPNGNFLWVKQIGGADMEFGELSRTDTNGNIYVTGYFTDEVDFDPGVNIHNLESYGNSDIFVLKLDTDGNFVWVNQMGGTESENGKSLFVDLFQNVYITGFFRGTVDFDPGTGTNNIISNGATDIFVQKLSQDLTAGIDDFLKEETFIIYPNPNNGQFNINFENHIPKSIVIYDSTSRVIFSSSNNVKSSFDLNVSAGIYIVRIQLENEFKKMKLIVK